MALTVRSCTPDDSATLSEIVDTSARMPELTPRSRSVIDALARTGDVIVAHHGTALAGWAVREPLMPGLKELGMLFVKPEFRRTGVLAIIVRELAHGDSSYLFATYSDELARLAEVDFGFRRASFVRVLWRSRGHFLRKRLSKSARASIAPRIARSRPIFLLREDTW